MLKSTYKPSAVSPLPAGWTEHKAPTGHTYYYNASTGVSTYTRPLDAVTSFMQHQAVPAINLSDPNVANAFMAQYNAPPPAAAQHNQRHDQGPRRPPPQPKDKPKSKVPIPGHEPWLLVYTKYGRRFAYNPVKNASYWRIPEKLLPAVVEIDKARILEKSKPTGANEGDKVLPKKESDKAEVGAQRRPAASAEPTPAQPDDDKGYDSSEYEEVEVTDDEGEDGDHDEEGHARKRQRTDEPDQPAEEAPVEFTEADIAAQLAAMEADYAQDDEYMDEEDDETPQLSELDARALFKDLLDDFGINPYSPWEKLIEEGKVFSDARYTVLTSTRARKEVWEEWCRERIAQLKELRAKQEKQDPRIPYMAFLAEKATPKLYWPEFRRKYRQEPIMRDSKLTDKDREKWYREHISRLKLPQSTLKADLRKLLESVGLQELNNQTRMERLPGKLLGDVRWISLDAKTRDPIVEAYIQSLRGPPEDGEQTGEEEEGAKKAREEKERRERALRERERAVAEEKRQKEKQLAYGRAQLREEERELERAMQVGKRGLQSQLDAGRGERPNDR